MRDMYLEERPTRVRTPKYRRLTRMMQDDPSGRTALKHWLSDKEAKTALMLPKPMQVLSDFPGGIVFRQDDGTVKNKDGVVIRLD